MHRVLTAAIGVLTATSLVTAQAPQTSVRANGPARTIVVPGSRAMTTIQGNAISSTNGALPNSVVRLRDARAGRIIDATITDQAGLFVFRAVEPGSYIVELVGADQTVL